MKVVHRVNNGFYVESVYLKEGEQIPSDCVEADFPSGTFLPAKVVNGKFVTILSQEEINAKKNPPKQRTQLEVLQETVDQLVLDNLMRGF